MDAPKPWDQGAAPWGGAEIEELPAQPVLGRGRARPGLSAALAGGLVLLIVAAGLGVLGGRPGASPAGSAVARASESLPAGPSPYVAPLVTPAVECLPLQAGELPEVRLAVPSGGGIYPGAVDIQEWHQPGPQPTSPIVPSDPETPARIVVRADTFADLRTTGNPCATAWAITLDDGGGEIDLERFASPADQPDYARQNRFTLQLAPFRGQQWALYALLEFPGVITRTVWPIDVPAIDAPDAQLTRGKRDIEVEPGCNVVLALGDIYSEQVNPCSDDVARLPRPARLVVPGAPLILRFPKTWYVTDAGVTCGSIVDLRFEPDPTGTCTPAWNADGVSLSIEGLVAAGTWTLAIDTCATQLLSDVTNQACGTWYATIEARRSTN